MALQVLKKMLVALACVISLLFIPVHVGATALPILGINDVASSLVGVQPDACEPGAVGAMFAFERDKTPYKLIVLARALQSQHFILLSLEEGDNTPVWFGTVQEDGSLKVRKEMIYNDFLKLAESVGGACGILGRDV